MAGVLMQIFVLYGPMWTCILFDLIAYSLIWRKQRLMVPDLNKTLITTSQNRVLRLTRYMVGYPLVTVFSWILPTAQHICDLYSWDNDLFSQVSQVTEYIQGFLVFLIYCKTSPALKLWMRAFRKIFNPPPPSLQQSQTQSQASAILRHTSSYPPNMSLPPRLFTTETSSTSDMSPSFRRMVFESSENADYHFGDDEEEEYEEEEYEGHRFQNTSLTQQRCLDSSFRIPPIISEDREGEGEEIS